MELENCYGIQKMDAKIDYSKNNVAVIYAPNGTMKSSLAKTFESIRDEKPVQEKIFGRQSVCKITNESGDKIKGEKILVINPFNENVYENQGLLMANEELRQKYLLIHTSIQEKQSALYEQVKKQLKYSNRKGFDVFSNILKDWKNTFTSEYEYLEDIYNHLYSRSMECALNHDELDYEILFNEKVYKIIKSEKMADLLEEYEVKYNQLVNESQYMHQGIIDHTNYANISSTLNSNGFFEANNELALKAKDGSDIIYLKSQSELDALIVREKEMVLNSKEIKELFEKIDKAMTKNKDMQAFNLFLQKKPDIVSEYKDIDLFKKKVWIKAFKEFEDLLEELLSEYKMAQDDLKELTELAKEEKTDWEDALELFRNRFYVPFSIETSNLEDVILKSKLPSFKYVFTDLRGDKEVSKENLLEILSTGEKRAYYILNMIFQILVASQRGDDYLIVLDDISESFDYKNKYAIIEYINDISMLLNEGNEKKFKILLLTHNFDFYRTVASRITKPGNAFITCNDCGEIKLEKGQYTKNIFNFYKQQLLENYSHRIMIATIPFVRNLIEYTEGVDAPDYLMLTSILHYKKDTKNITLEEIQNIFNRHWSKKKEMNFAQGRETESIYDILMEEAEQVVDLEKLEIESKLILSMATRLKAESYMIKKILLNIENGASLIEEIQKKNNQSAQLIKEYKEKINDKVVKELELVSMITPQNIHLNSFMFEPILDMSVKRLLELYNKVKEL